jgi:hypothetical protein
MSWRDVTDKLQSIYVDDDDRFVVALVVGYPMDETLIEEFGHASAPELAACAAALELTRDGEDTQWFVLDRETGESRSVEQGDFDRDIHGSDVE